MRRSCAVALACVLMLLAGCVAASPPPQATGTALMPGATPGATTIAVGDRSVLLYDPASRPSDPTGGAALVVALHGYTGDAAGVVEFFGLRRTADQHGFVIAAPQGTSDSEGRTFWNASRACCDFGGSAVDDSDHLLRVIDTVVATHGIDPARVYVVGHSNGGFMAHRLACEHAGRVAAIASVAGAFDTDATCRPAEPVSVLQIHGKADDTILYDGGAIEGRPYTSVAETVALWRGANDCRSDARPGARLDADSTLAGDDLTATTWTNCRGNSEVAVWSIAEGSHNPALTPAFTAALFDWFEAHRRTE